MTSDRPVLVTFINPIRTSKLVNNMDNAINEQAVNDDIVEEQKQTFAAVPIHFRPGEGKTKLIKLVIPGIEPPLGFFEVTGGSPEELTLTAVSGPEASGDDVGVEDKVEQTEDSQPTPESEALDAELLSEEQPDEETSEESEDEDDIEYPHEDDNGDPVAGFLLGSEDAQPLVILVRPSKGQTVQEAMDEESAKHPEHRPGTLEEATKLLGHSPLTSEDN